MIKILICDDDCVFANKLSCEIRKTLDEISKSAQIHVFQFAEEIPLELFSECDIAFLDIDFCTRKYTGIDIARKLRESNRDAVIIFVTNYPEYAPEGYEVQAFRYLLKSDIESKLNRYLLQAFEHLTEKRRYFQIPQSGDVITVSMDDILYFESQLHMVEVHLVGTNKNRPTSYRYYAVLSDIENTLTPHGFLRIHKSYIVNMKHLQTFTVTEATLSDGTPLKVSKQNYSIQKKKYLLWKGRH